VLGWRRWIRGPKHGLPAGVAVFGVPRPEAAHLDELLGRCDQLRTFAQAHGSGLGRVPGDTGLLDEAFDEAVDTAYDEPGGSSRIAALASEAGLYLGTVMTATLPCNFPMTDS